jgi:CsoR family transcriptional regulator, copper-sensing transcriptional repressor
VFPGYPGTYARDVMSDLPDKELLVNRLRRIEGQVRGLQRMIEEGRDCAEVVIQLAAVQAALDRAGHHLVSSSLRACLDGAILPPETERQLDRGLAVLASLR